MGNKQSFVWGKVATSIFLAVFLPKLSFSTSFAKYQTNLYSRTYLTPWVLSLGGGGGGGWHSGTEGGPYARYQNSKIPLKH